MNTLKSGNTGQPPEEPPMRLATTADWWRMLYPDLDQVCSAYHEPRRTYDPPRVHTEVASNNEAARRLIPNS